MLNKTQYERILNELPLPDRVRQESKKVVKATVYGSWLRRNDPIQFNVMYNDYVRGLNNGM